MSAPSGPIRVSVGGGKGGVGKSLVAVNLATALAASGTSVVLVDADLGAPTLHTLLGVDRLGPTVQALVDRRIASLEEAVVTTAVRGVRLVPGTSRPGAANLAHQEKLKLVRHVRALDAEVVIIDVGAGAGFHTLDFFAAGEVRLSVATPELTSLQNAYCFLKASLSRELRVMARSMGGEDAWSAAFDSRDMAKVGACLDRLAVERPDVARRAHGRLARFGARWVGNRVGTDDARRAIDALPRLAREFLMLDVPIVTAIPPSRALEHSIAERRPALVSPRAEPALVAAFERLAEHVVSHDRRAQRSLVPSAA